MDASNFGALNEPLTLSEGKREFNKINPLLEK
jgi:hypothetical protein